MRHESVSPDTNPVAVVDRTEFKQALDALKLVAETRGTIPILSNVKLSADLDKLLLIATDMDINLLVRIDGEVDGRVATTLPVGLLHSMCGKATKSDRVSLTLLPSDPEKIIRRDDEGRMVADDDGNWIYDERQYDGFVSDKTLVRFGSTDYRVNSITPEDFPELEDFKGKTWRFTLPGSSLWNAIDATMAAVSTEETRYYLNGLYFHHQEDRGSDNEHGSLRVVATDGHRLYSQTVQAPRGAAEMPGVIIPHKTVKILHKLMKGKACPRQVQIRMDDKFVWFTWGNMELRTKVVDGTFPDYARVMPAANSNVATFSPAELIAAIDAVTVISSERGRAVKMTFTKGKCTLTVVNSDAGSSETSLEIDSNFDELEVGYNASYLRDIILKASPDWEDIKIKMNTPGDPAVIEGSLAGWTGVLMPMRV